MANKPAVKKGAAGNGHIEIVYIPAKKLMPLEKNPRRLADPDGQEKLATEIRVHGFQNPLQVYREKNGKYSILCGNHRFRAALELMEEFPCIVYKGERNKAIARAISDNKSHEWTEWDFPLLKDALVELDDGDFDMELTGFSEVEIEGMFAVHDDSDMDNGGVPESFRSIMVNFENKKDVEDFGQLLGREIKGGTKYLWYKKEKPDG